MIYTNIDGVKNMEKETMISSSLSKLNGTTKDLINSGIWFLYKVRYTENENVKYCLSADQIYLLDSEGAIISKMSITPKEMSTESTIIFSDLPKPEISSNNVVKVWG